MENFLFISSILLVVGGLILNLKGTIYLVKITPFIAYDEDFGELLTDVPDKKSIDEQKKLWRDGLRLLKIGFCFQLGGIVLPIIFRIIVFIF